MSLLRTNFLVKPQHGNELYMLVDLCSGNKYWVNQASIDALVVANSSNSIEEVVTGLVDKGYPSMEVDESIPSLCNEWEGLGLVGSTSDSKSRHIEFLQALHCDYQMDSLTVCLTNRCNYECIYCYNKKAKPVDIPGKELFDILECALFECGAVSFTFTGGEPFLHPSLYDAIALVKKNKRICNVLTNGNLLTRENINTLADIGVDNVGISIDTLDPQLYQLMTRSTLLPEQILNAIQLCTEYGIKVEANIVLVDGYNLEAGSLCELKSSLIDRGVSTHVVSEATPTDNKPHSICSIADTGFRENLIACLGSASQKTGHPDSDHDARFCGIGQNGLIVSSNGIVLTCPALADFPVGDIHQQSLTTIWCSSPELLKIRNKILTDFPICSECSESSDCGGGCRAKAYHYYGKLWYPDPISCIQHRVEPPLKSL